MVGRIIDDISGEESKHHEENEYEEQDADVWYNDILHLAQFYGQHDQLPKGQEEAHTPQQKSESDRDEEEGEIPCIVVIR